MERIWHGAAETVGGAQRKAAVVSATAGDRNQLPLLRSRRSEELRVEMVSRGREAELDLRISRVAAGEHPRLVGGNEQAGQREQHEDALRRIQRTGATLRVRARDRLLQETDSGSGRLGLGRGEGNLGWEQSGGNL